MIASRQTPPSPYQPTPATAKIGPSVRPNSPAAIKMLMPLPVCVPEMRPIMAGAGA